MCSLARVVGHDSRLTTRISIKIKITIMSSMKKLPTRRLGANGPEVSAIGLGTMGTSESIQSSISLKS